MGEGKLRSFEGWMISHLAVGAGFSAFVTLLIPPNATRINSNAAEPLGILT